MIYTLLAFTSLLPGQVEICLPCDETPFPQPVPREEHLEKNDFVRIDRESYDALIDLAERHIYNFERGAIPADICIRRLEEIIKYLDKFAIYEEKNK